MYCKCKNNDIYPGQFVVGGIYQCRFLDELDGTHAKVVIYLQFPDDSIVLGWKDFIHSFDYWE